MKLSPKHIKSNFLDLIYSLKPEDVAKSMGDFSRNRLCSHHDTILILLSMGGHALNKEISNYYFEVSRQRPSKSAFCQQRAKLKEDTFIDLLHASNQLFPLKKTFKGLHLLAADGSDLNIPSFPGDDSTFIPYNSRNGGYYQYHLNALYDLLEERFVDAVVTPRRKFDENGSLQSMVDRDPISGPCLYIADRGYCSFNTLAHIIHMKQFFLIRSKAPSDSASFIRSVPVPDSDDFDIDHAFVIGRGTAKKHKAEPFDYKRIKKSQCFDFIPPDDKDKTFTIPFRLLRVLLPSGEFEYLVTNLPRKKFPHFAIKELYNLRWGIETSFRRLKYNVALAYFHSRKRDFIRQEIFARLIMYNFYSLLISSFNVEKKDTKYVYRIAFSDAVVNCHRYLMEKMSVSKLKDLLLMSLVPVRPGRSSPRNVRSQRLRTLNNRN